MHVQCCDIYSIYISLLRGFRFEIKSSEYSCLLANPAGDMRAFELHAWFDLWETSRELIERPHDREVHLALRIKRLRPVASDDPIDSIYYRLKLR